jgi:putative hemolysin
MQQYPGQVGTASSATATCQDRGPGNAASSKGHSGDSVAVCIEYGRPRLLSRMMSKKKPE